MNLSEKRLYHQVHPLKLATDIGVTVPFLYFLWRHQVASALLIGFIPPLVVSAVLMKWAPDLERIKNSALGHYLKVYMTPAVELARLLTLAPMAYGAWEHEPGYIVLGMLAVVVAWCNGLIWTRRAT
jgi:hypothetical protein